MLRLSAAGLTEILSDDGAVRAAFNFAAPLDTVEFDRHLLRDVIVPLNKPKLVLYGLIPTNLPMERSAAQIEAEVSAYPVFTVYAPTPAALLHRFVLHDVDLPWRMRRHLFTTKEQASLLWMKTARRITASGDTPVPFPGARGPSELGRDERERLTKLFRDFETQMTSSPLFANLASFASTCTAAGVRLAILINPVHPLYLELLPHGAADLERFHAKLRETAAKLGLPLFEPGEEGLGAPDLYVDATHHNQAGMDWLTDEVGGFLRREGF